MLIPDKKKAYSGDAAPLYAFLFPTIVQRVPDNIGIPLGRVAPQPTVNDGRDAGEKIPPTHCQQTVIGKGWEIFSASAPCMRFQ